MSRSTRATVSGLAAGRASGASPASSGVDHAGRRPVTPGWDNGDMLDTLAEAIEGVEIHADERELAQALGLRDRLDAKITSAVGAFDAAELWDGDGSVSMAAWLRIHAGRTQRDATRLTVTARKLRS